MIHMDWEAWDRWMEAHDDLVQQGIVPTCEEITRAYDAKTTVTDRDRNIQAMHKMNKDLATLERTKLGL